MRPAHSFVVIVAALSLLTCATWSQDKTATALPVSPETQSCLDCHKSVTPGIVEDWLTSLHAKISPAVAIKKPVLQRRISNEAPPEPVLSNVVGCYECHGQNPTKHKDNFDHFGYKINVVVSPQDCRICHPLEVQQYSEGKKAHAVGNLSDNSVYHLLVETIDGMKTVKGTTVTRAPATENTKHETCYACHGTAIEVKGSKTLATSLGDIEVPDLTQWPNQGVGRFNPDGSLGSCTACHPRHSFSIEIARKPFTCSQCHLKPDLPAWDVYRESKHGNIMMSKEHEQIWNSVPWKVGQDFRTPTCATCHNSLVTTPEGEVVVQRNHDFGSRLWVRIFGLIASHPQPKSGNTSIIKNQDGLPLPTTFMGLAASGFLIGADEQARRQEEMKKVCRSCHGSSWADLHFVKLARTNAEADSMVLAATKLMVQGWEKKLADKTNPFDEMLEQKWIKQWLFYANSVRYASAMAGPDYATFEYGWWDLTRNLEEMRDHLERYSAKKK